MLSLRSTVKLRRAGKDLTFHGTRLILIAALLALALLGPRVPFVKSLDDGLIASRFEWAPRQATKRIVFAAIDKRSLDDVGVWPWPRSIHAKLIDRLVAAGASDIFFDIDFSTPSSPAEDSQLETSLAAARGTVVLPEFLQHTSAADGQAISVSQPIGRFASNAWLASVNVEPDGDGLVRRFRLGEVIGGTPTQSVSATLARSSLSAGSLPIDFSIAPSSVPAYSASDILAGNIGAKEISGRSVIVGAYATELKDSFAVPAGRVISGPMVNILGAETLLQGRILRAVDPSALLLVLAASIVGLGLSLAKRHVTVPIACVCGLGSAIETLAVFMQARANVLIGTTTVWIMLAIGLLLVINEKVDISRVVAEIAGKRQRGTRRVLQRVLADSSDMVLIFDDHLEVIEMSSSAAALGPKTQSRGQLQSYVPSDIMLLIAKMASSLKQRGVPCTSHSEFTLGDGEVSRRIEASITLSPTEYSGEKELARFIGNLTMRDVTARHLYEQKLKHLSRFDSLTDALNRRAFCEDVSTLKGPKAVAVVDIHRFAILNATLGRAIGDTLLRAVATRLKTIPHQRAVGYLGGGVFAIAMEQPDSIAETVAQAVLAMMAEPFFVDQTAVQTTARVGVCAELNDGHAGDQWLDAAEQALDVAKSRAGGGWSIFDPALALHQIRSRRLEQDMRQGLANKEFFMLYQPQVDLKDGEIVGAEALIRWQHPELGMVPPSEFIPIAETSGLIVELGRFALLEACCAAARWPSHISVAVNVSALQLSAGHVLTDIKEAIERSGIAPNRLHIELTESAFASGTDEVVTALASIRAEGCLVALDDFGTGYSSLSYLAGLPLDKLKIDQSFVRRMATDRGSLAIIEAIVSLAQSLTLELVAEGIESDKEWSALSIRGCQYGQGYFFGKPMTTDELARLASDGPRVRSTVVLAAAQTN